MKWGKTMKKKESPYIDGLDQMDIKASTEMCRTDLFFKFVYCESVLDNN